MTTRFGIVCVTGVNQSSSWLNFETGILAGRVSAGQVCPYLIDLPSSEVKGPLTQFQGTPATKPGTLALLTAINRAFGSPLSSDLLHQSFAKQWPRLNKTLARLPEASEGTASSTPEWPGVKTSKSLGAKLSKISITQRALFREILKSDARLKADIFKTFFMSKNRIGGDRSGGLYVQTLATRLSIDRTEAIYRCKELENDELIGSQQLTDICFRATDSVVRLTNRSPKAILSPLYSAQEIASLPPQEFNGTTHYKDGHIDYRADLDGVPLERRFQITDTGLPGMYEFQNDRVAKIFEADGKELAPEKWSAWETGR